MVAQHQTYGMGQEYNIMSKNNYFERIGVGIDITNSTICIILNYTFRRNVLAGTPLLHLFIKYEKLSPSYYLTILFSIWKCALFVLILLISLLIPIFLKFSSVNFSMILFYL